MSGSPVHEDGDAGPDAAPSPGELVARLESREDGPDQCTLYPTGVDDEALMTRWLTADEGSYVAVESMR